MNLKCCGLVGVRLVKTHLDWTLSVKSRTGQDILCFALDKGVWSAFDLF